MISADKIFTFPTLVKVLMVFSVIGFGSTVYNYKVSINEPSSSSRNGEIVENLRETIDRDEAEAQQLRVDEKLIIFRLNRIESRLLRLELETRETRT